MGKKILLLTIYIYIKKSIMDLVKKCPKCGCEQRYKSLVTYNRAIESNACCHKCVAIGKHIKNNANVLLNENLETYYWIGFILADGSIKSNNRLVVSLSNKDAEHLEKLGCYISTNIKYSKQVVSLSAMSVAAIPRLCEKFDIKQDKTYNPPDINLIKKIEHDKILALIIGFIDGDGSIKNQWKRKDFSIAIKNHSSWLYILNYFSDIITNKKLAKINSKGYASLHITRCSDIIKLKNFAIEKKLPILERKWDIVDINYVNRTIIAEKNKQKIKDLLAQGKTIKEISVTLGLLYDTVYMIIKRNKLK